MTRASTKKPIKISVKTSPKEDVKKEKTFEEVSKEIFGNDEMVKNTVANMRALANSEGWRILCELISAYKEQAEYELSCTPITPDNINEKEWLRKERIIWDNILKLPSIIISSHETNNEDSVENFDPYN